MLNNLPNNTILDIIEFKNNNFCLACYDFNIRFVELYENNNKYKIIQVLNGHKNNINSVRKLLYYEPEIVIASSSADGTIALWKYYPKKNCFKNFKRYKINGYAVESMEESIKYNQLIIGISSIKQIVFYNLNNLKMESINIKVNRCIRALKIIDDNDILIAAGNQEINLIDIKSKLIIFCMKFGFECEFNCVFQKKKWKYFNN